MWRHCIGCRLLWRTSTAHSPVLSISTVTIQTVWARDSGWIQLFSEDSQEVYDNLIQAVRIAEHKDVLLPVMVCFDGFIISHTMQILETLPKEKVQQFVGEYTPVYTLLDLKNPITVGSLDLPAYFFEHKRKQAEAMKNAFAVIQQVGKDYGKLSGRSYDFAQKYRLEDAEIVLVALGSVCGTAMAAIDNARKRGISCGLLKLRVFRPFPAEEIVKALQSAKLVTVLDRSISFGLGGPLFHEVCSASYQSNLRTPIVSAIYGLGGRDTTVDDLEAHIKKLASQLKSGEFDTETSYIALRE